MMDEAMKAARSALIDADRLADCSERLLSALNMQAGAQDRLDVAELGGDAEAHQRAEDELEHAKAEVSEFWRAVRSSTYEYRKRAERARQAMGSNAEVSGAGTASAGLPG